MFLDKDLMIAEKKDIPIADGIMGDMVNLGTYGRLAGEPLYLVIKFTTALTGTSPKVTFLVQTSTDNTFASPKTLVASPEITASDDIGTGIKPLIIPINVPYAEKYLRVFADVSGTITGGAATVMLLLDAQTAGLQKQADNV